MIHEIARERAQSFLKPEHQSRVLAAYKAFSDEPGLAVVADLAAIEKQGFTIDNPNAGGSCACGDSFH